MKVLFIGDVFGSLGRRILATYLKPLKQELSIDCVIANGENAAGGRGITKQIAKKFFKYGVNIITGGNHSLVRDDVFTAPPLFASILRPHNIDKNFGGKGFYIYYFENGQTLAVINLIGRTFMQDNVTCPFACAKHLLEEIRQTTKNIIIDFHAETTSEKICLAHYFDGSISALCGTHTHVQTADERILLNGTAFISDVGMTGPENSAIGMKFEAVIDRYLTNMKTRFEPSSNAPMLNAVLIDIDHSTGKARSLQRIYKRISFLHD